MALSLIEMLDCLDVERADDHTYLGANYPFAARRVFGGQVLAQGIRCLAASVPSKQVKSFTQHFTREGDVDQRIEYTVDVIHEGRTFGAATVRASQGDRVIGLLSASLHAPEAGPERFAAAPDLSGPDEAEPVDLRVMPWELRLARGGSLTDPAVREPRFAFWMRAPELASGSDQWLHQALLAHASEPTLIGTALFPVDGISQADAQVRFTSAVTTHSMWFHTEVDLRQWLLIDQHSPVMSGSRVFGRSDIWSEDGRLVASATQESLVRFSD